MTPTALPPVLDDVTLARQLNDRLRAGAVELDWTGVTQASDEALDALLERLRFGPLTRARVKALAAGA